MRIKAGDIFRCVGPAGGGYGNPLERDPQAVLDDVLDGLISAETAKAAFGVVVSGDGTVDSAATDSLRAAS